MHAYTFSPKDIVHRFLLVDEKQNISGISWGFFSFLEDRMIHSVLFRKAYTCTPSCLCVSICAQEDFQARRLNVNHVVSLYIHNATED